MLDDMKDLIDQEVQGVKVKESSFFAIIGKRPSWELGPNAPLYASLSYRFEGSRDHHVKQPLQSISCLA